MERNLSLFAACAPGLEPMLAGEVEALSPAEHRVVPGGVELTGDPSTLYRANLELGLALRVLVRLGTVRATRWNQLVAGCAAMPWEHWLDPAGPPPAIKVTASKSRLHHTKGIAERVTAGITERLGNEPSGQGDALGVQVRIVRDRCTVSIDSSGELLSRRGYRQATGKAPLREDLARALIIASGWDRRSPLADPMCGSGTIAIEAALLSTNAAPGAGRRFAFMQAPGFDRPLWQQLVAAAADRRQAQARIMASDRDAGAVAAAGANAGRAGVKLELAGAALSDAPVFTAPPAEPGAVVSNPPYGRRVRGAPDLRPLYQRLGALVRDRLPGWRVALAVADPAMAAQTGLGLTSRLMTDHGGRKIYFETT